MNEEVKITLEQSMLDDEFQQILLNDEVSKRLQESDKDEQGEHFLIMSILSPICRISGVTVSYITPAIWCFLYSIKNAYTCDKKIDEQSTDVFMYVLSKGLKNIDDSLLEKSFKFCELNKLNYIEVKNDLLNLIYLAFKPLQMLPRVESNEQVRYDADWLTKIVSISSIMSNRKSNDVMFNMSLSQCCFYYIQYLRKDDIHNKIHRRSSDQINKMLYDRMMELGEQYYNEKYLKVSNEK